MHSDEPNFKYLRPREDSNLNNMVMPCRKDQKMEAPIRFNMPTNASKMKRLLLPYSTQLPLSFFIRQGTRYSPIVQMILTEQLTIWNI